MTDEALERIYNINRLYAEMEQLVGEELAGLFTAQQLFELPSIMCALRRAADPAAKAQVILARRELQRG